jgi:hypothetical protein
MTIAQKRDKSKIPQNLIISKGDFLFTPRLEKIKHWKEHSTEPEWRIKQRKKDMRFSW